MGKKITLWGEFMRQGGWLLEACTTDVLKEMTGTKKKKSKSKSTSHQHYHVHNHFYPNKKPRR